MISHILLLEFSKTTVNGLPFDAPRATSVVNPKVPCIGWTPQPTEAPVPHELLRRDTKDSCMEKTVLVAIYAGFLVRYSLPIECNPLICLGFAHNCPADRSCVLVPATSSQVDAAGCCNSDSCNLVTACVDWSQWLNDAVCNNACKLNTRTLKCVNPVRAYCNTVWFPELSIADYVCDTVQVSGSQVAFRKYSGEATTEGEGYWSTSTYDPENLPTSSGLGKMSVLLLSTTVTSSYNAPGSELHHPAYPRKKSQKASQFVGMYFTASGVKVRQN